jgi:HlyD family secretion protein
MLTPEEWSMSAQSLPVPQRIGVFVGRLKGVAPWVYWVLVALVAMGLIAGMVTSRARSAVHVATQPVVRQTLVQSVTASGTVNPQNSISVGTQVSGTIAQIFVDYNSEVHKGQVLAKIDPSTFQAQLDQAKAALAQAQAQAAEAGANATGASSGVMVAQANAQAQRAAANSAKTNIAKAQSALTLAQQQLNRDEALYKQGYMAQSTVQSDQSNVAQDQAALAAAQASHVQAQAQAQGANATVGENGSTAQAQAANAQAARAAVQAAEATVQQDQVNLDHTVITSPVDGTVVARDVSVGQTVAASLQTPTLFSIAQDLSKMEVDINVGEPDIGGVKPGDSVDFTVLAYPNTTFHGTVSQVRINPTTLNNVVTYDVVVLVNNKGGKLLPGMTADATINVNSAPNALVVPLAAVHGGAAQPSAGGAQSSTVAARGTSESNASPWGQTSTSGGGAVYAGQNGVVTVERGKKVQRVPVNVVLTTTTQAAVVPIDGAKLSPGDAVVTGFSSGTRPASSGQRSQSGQPNVQRAMMRGIP